ncbi:MAG: oligosaccharide flippase family protein [Candidatus Devosia euplotis]|nr:oligosaccharide flippase family protein [Candidatus Devosia euplotis]
MILVILGRAAQFILLMIANRLLTEFLPPEEMGRLSLVTAAIGLFGLFLVSPVGQFINRRLHAWDDLGRARHYLTLHWLHLTIVCGLAALGLVLLQQLSVLSFGFSIGWLLLLVCGSLFFNTINQTAIPSLNLLGFSGTFMALTLGTITLGLFASYVSVQLFGASAEYWLTGQLLGQAVFAAIGVWLFFSYLKPATTPQPFSRDKVMAMFNFAWPVALASGFSWLQSQGYRLVSVDELGLAPLGLFVAGYGIAAGLMAAFESILTTYFQPRFYKSINQGAGDRGAAWTFYASAFVPSVILVTCFLAALAPELTRFLVGPDYQSASQFVIWGVLAEGARVLVGVYSMSAHAEMKTSLLLWPNALGALLCIALVWLLVPGYGAAGVGIARVASGLALVLAVHYVTVGTLRMGFPYELASKGLLLGGLLYGAVALMRGPLGSDSGSYTSAGALILLADLMLLGMLVWLLLPFVRTRAAR